MPIALDFMLIFQIGSKAKRENKKHIKLVFYFMLCFMCMENNIMDESNILHFLLSSPVTLSRINCQYREPCVFPALVLFSTLVDRHL